MNDISAQDRITVVAADSQPLTLLGLTRTIEQTPELELLNTATDGPGALGLIEARGPQVATLGARLPRSGPPGHPPGRAR